MNNWTHFLPYINSSATKYYLKTVLTWPEIYDILQIIVISKLIFSNIHTIRYIKLKLHVQVHVQYYLHIFICNIVETVVCNMKERYRKWWLDGHWKRRVKRSVSATIWKSDVAIRFLMEMTTCSRYESRDTRIVRYFMIRSASGVYGTSGSAGSSCHFH